MRLLLDIGNTRTHAALAGKRIGKDKQFPTADWSSDRMGAGLKRFIGRTTISQALICSVVPSATRAARAWLCLAGIKPIIFNHKNCGLGINYPNPATIGPDRLANGLAARAEFGSPVVVVDFGTAVTFDIINHRGNYTGGIIAPGLSAMTDYLHEKTALLPRIELRNPRTAIGKSTEEAMLIGAVHGYRGLVQALIGRIGGQLRARRLPVIATGGHANLLAKGIPEITAVRPLLTLEGLRIASDPNN
jgi:type III pantothenate kinase